jgi:hypothetical protein
MTPPLPSGQPPSVETVVRAVIEVLPADQRAEARNLIEPIVRHRLAGLASHPRPERLAQVVYDNLAAAIAEAGPDQALPRLREEALRTEVDILLQDSLALAIARYGVEHPESAGLSRAWASHHPEWLGHGAAFYAAEAGRLQQTREGLLQRVNEAPPEIAGPLRPELLRANLNLSSAASGAFATASGPLADFLRDAGAAFQYLDFE